MLTTERIEPQGTRVVKPLAERMRERAQDMLRARYLRKSSEHRAYLLRCATELRAWADEVERLSEAQAWLDVAASENRRAA